MYDLAILGGGPAAMTAALYAARKKLPTLMMATDIGGQMMLTNDIENWIGTKKTSGFDLTRRFEDHLGVYDGIDRRIGETVTGLSRDGDSFTIVTNRGASYTARTVIIATGKQSRLLDVPGETEHASRGISYCATCDAPIYAGRRVAVVGGGNSALQAVIDLIPIAEHITVVNVSPEWQADAVLIDRIAGAKHVTALRGWEVTDISGEKRVEAITIKNTVSGKTRDIAVGGIFVEIGLIPNSDFAADIVKCNVHGEIIVDCLSRTSEPGIYAAGDVTTVPAKQIVVATGEGAKAALSAYDYLIMNGFWSDRATATKY